jgi:hypothetical protein
MILKPTLALAKIDYFLFELHPLARCVHTTETANGHLFLFFLFGQCRQYFSIVNSIDFIVSLLHHHLLIVFAHHLDMFFVIHLVLLSLLHHHLLIIFALDLEMFVIVCLVLLSLRRWRDFIVVIVVIVVLVVLVVLVRSKEVVKTKTALGGTVDLGGERSKRVIKGG